MDSSCRQTQCTLDHESGDPPETPSGNSAWPPQFPRDHPRLHIGTSLSCHLAASDTSLQSAFLNMLAHGREFCCLQQSFRVPWQDAGGLDAWLRRASCCDDDQDECAGHQTWPAMSRGTEPEPDQGCSGQHPAIATTITNASFWIPSCWLLTYHNQKKK